MARCALTAVTLVRILCMGLGPSLGDRAQLAPDQTVVTFMYGDVQVRYGTSHPPWPFWASAESPG